MTTKTHTTSDTQEHIHKQTRKDVSDKHEQKAHQKKAKKVGHPYLHSLTTNKTYLFIGIVIIAIAALFLIMHLVSNNDDVLVRVNDQVITQQELDAQWNALPPQTRLTLTKEALLEELIQESLLLQEAQTQGLTVTQEEVEMFISDQLAQNGATIEQFKQILAAQQIDYTTIEDIYRKQLLIAKLFDQTVTDEQVTATDEEITTFYETNQEQFLQEAQVTVRHILIQQNEQVNASVVDERVNMILEGLAQDRSRFCDYVSNYTADRASEPTCGRYTFGMASSITPAFKNASFSMEIGDIEPVETEFGIHIIEKLNEADEMMLNLTNEVQGTDVTVEEIIQGQIEQQKARTVFDAYLQTLKDTATIEYVNPIQGQTTPINP